MFLKVNFEALPKKLTYRRQYHLEKPEPTKNKKKETSVCFLKRISKSTPKEINLLLKIPSEEARTYKK